MKLPDCSRMEREIWKYVDRELPAEALGAVSRHLQECESCQELYLTRARESNLYRVALNDSPFGKAFTARFSERLAREGLMASPGEGDLTKTLGGRSLEERFAAARRRRFVAAAALLVVSGIVLTLAVVFHRDFEKPGLGTFHSTAGVVRVQLVDEGEPGGQLEASRAGRIFPGDSFEVSEGTDLTLDLLASDVGGATELLISGPAVFWVEADARVDEFRGRLERGVLLADVGKDAARASFSIETPDAVATVLGTRFMLEVLPGVGTELEVEHGKVAFRSRLDLPTHRVNVEGGAGRWVVQAGVRGVAPVAEKPVAENTAKANPAPSSSGAPVTQPPATPSPRSPSIDSKILDQPVVVDPEKD